ncbi:uncharacterized protein LOC144124486 [Amblyomma americanum]
MDRPSKRQTHCFAPGCASGYVSSRKKDKKASVFSAPIDEERFKAWQRAIPRADRPLEKTSVLCELHFEPRFIVRDYTHIVNGGVVKIPRGRPCLSEDAVPTIFPNTPHYLSKKLPQKRLSRTSRGEVVGKKRKVDDGAQRDMALSSDEGTSDATADDAVDYDKCSLDKLDYLLSEKLLSKYWSKSHLEGAPRTVAFSVFAQAREGACFKKLVLCSAEDTHYHCSVFVQGVCLKKEDLPDAESVEKLLYSVDNMNACCGFEKNLLEEKYQSLSQAKYRMHGNNVHSKTCSGASLDERACIQCRYLRKLLLNQASYKRRNAKVTPAFSAAKKLMRRDQQLRRERGKVGSLEGVLSRMKDENAAISSSKIEDRLTGLPEKQQEQVRACFKASNRKGTQGMRYSQQWILECILMRLKSPKLYEHIRRHKIMVLPSKSCLLKYMKNYKSSFGFNENVLAAVLEKTKTMDEYERHGGILIDEMKLSENLKVTSSGLIEGFVDLGAYTSPDQTMERCDHGLVVLFQPFSGQFQQILGVFGSRSNVKADILSKIILDATLAAEKAGLFVNFVTTDGASWNRSMWRQFGIKGSQKKTVCKVKHPVDDSRSLHFLSDFPHLVKCVRNSVVKTGLQIPEGRVRPDVVKEAWKCDNRNVVRLQAMPHVTKAVIEPNGFEKMKVNYAFTFFSDEVLRGLSAYKNDIESMCGKGCSEPTVSFIRRMSKLISAMTSRWSRDAMRPKSQALGEVENFLRYLNAWEAEVKLGFISQGTAEGLRVTLSSTISILDYITGKLGYKYLLTARLSQDPLENIFGILRQMSEVTTTRPPPNSCFQQTVSLFAV